MNRAIRRVCVLTGSVVVAMTALAGPSLAAPVDAKDLTATAVNADSTYEAPASNSGQLAESDQALLNRTDSADVDVMVKLDYDAAASYDGSIAGLPATSPRVTGEELTGDSPAEQSYQDYTDELDAQFRSHLAAEVPGAVAGTSLSTVYGGVAVRLPADQAKDLLDIPGVAAVQTDVLLQPADQDADAGTTQSPTAGPAADAPAADSAAVTTTSQPASDLPASDQSGADQSGADQPDSTPAADATTAGDPVTSETSAAAGPTTETPVDPTQTDQPQTAQTSTAQPQSDQNEPTVAGSVEPDDTAATADQPTSEQSTSDSAEGETDGGGQGGGGQGGGGGSTKAIPESPQFIGASTLWNRLGGQPMAGRGVIFADIDTGIWPEHPMLADNKRLGTPPAAPSGQPRTCFFGDNPLTPAVDVFRCNSKVIGGQPFLATYNSKWKDQVYPDSARDSAGHGTHTTTTAAGNAVTSCADLRHRPRPDQRRGSGRLGALVQGVRHRGVLRLGLGRGHPAGDSGRRQRHQLLHLRWHGPLPDVAEMAMLDAYNAGVFVATSAGNDGPGSGTTGHYAPWVTTVAASTQIRQYTSTLTLTAAGARLKLTGTSLTKGNDAATPVVLAQNIAGYDAYCSTPLTAGQAAGVIVACQRGNDVDRAQKGVNVKAGDAAGMILYNLPVSDVETDNHFLPTVQLADGTEFLAFLAAHPRTTATFTAGTPTRGVADVMAAFSSRGPGGQFLKPDITAPGVQILAGNTPTPDVVASGPAGQYYQAIAGTSMAAPAIAGSAILLKALRPRWTPGAIKSALMTTAVTALRKEDLTTAADPFDRGAGRVDLTDAADAPIVFDEAGTRLGANGADPATAINLNLPSINLPKMPGSMTVTRTATNLTGRPYLFLANTTAPAGSKITVSPSYGWIKAGGTQTFKVTVTSTADVGQYYGAIAFSSYGQATVRMPVAWNNIQSAVPLTQSCDPTAVALGALTTCTVTAQNLGGYGADTTVRLDSTVSTGLRVESVTGGKATGARTASSGSVLLAAKKDSVPSIVAVDPAKTPGEGYFDLAGLGIKAVTIGNQELINFNVSPFVYGGQTISRIGVASDGYVVLGGGVSADISNVPQHFPDPAKPNGVLAPYWTDLDGTGAPGIRVASLGSTGQRGWSSSGTCTWPATPRRRANAPCRYGSA